MEESSSNVQTILVTGATGKQGRAFISSILSSSPGVDRRFRVLALTRDPSSPSAKSLITQAPHGHESDIELVQGDLDDPESLRTVFTGVKGGIWGVLAVLAFPGLGVSTEGERKQGYTIADLSLEFGVSHFIYSSAERGGETSDEKSIAIPRGVKVLVERHVKALGERGLKWTILRPGFFMENFDGTIGKITVAVTRAGLKPNTKLHLIAADDIGHVAANVFRNSEKYVDKIIPVVGDSLSAKEQDEAHRKATGHALPSIPILLAKPLLALNSHTRDLIAHMEQVHRDRSAMEGGAERMIQETREVYPDTQTFESWAKKRDMRGAQPAKGWNNLSIVSIITRKQ